MNFSVVVPLFNGERFIGPTLRSLAAQTVPPDEVVVVDDGSSDEGPRLVEEFRLPNGAPPRLVRHTSSLGVAAARNRGAFEAKGEWVAFCDNDDLWHPGRIEAILHVVSKHADANAVGTGTMGFALRNDAPLLAGHQREAMVHHWVDDDLLETLCRACGDISQLPERLLTFDDFRRETCVATTTICFRREWYATLGGCATWTDPLGDWVLNASAALHQPIHLIDGPLVFYRVRPASQSHGDDRLAWGALGILLALRFGGRSPDLSPSGMFYRHMVGIGARGPFPVREASALAVLGRMSVRSTARVVLDGARSAKRGRRST